MTDSKHLAGFTQRLLLAGLLLGMALAAWAIRDALLLGFAAILLAIAVHGVAGALTSRIALPHPAALAISAALLAGGLITVLWVFGTQIAAELTGIASRLPEAWSQAQETLRQNPLGSTLVSEIDAASSSESNGSLKSLLSSAGGYALPFASGLTSALLVLFIAGFVATSLETTSRGVLLLLPQGIDQRVGAALDASSHALKKWLLGITIDMIIVAALMALTLWLLGVPAFLGLALIAGVAQFVPTVGPLLAAVPGILMGFTVSPMTALWTATAYLVVSQLEANLIYPLIQKETASIPPALNLIAILAFGILLGPMGVLLATPILVVCTVFILMLYVRDTLGKEATLPGQQ